MEFGKLKKENVILKEIVGALTIEVEKLKKRSNRAALYQELVTIIKRRLREKFIFLGQVNLIRLLRIAKSSYFYRCTLPSKDGELKDRVQ